MAQLYTDSQSSDRHLKSDDARKKRDGSTQSLSIEETKGLRAWVSGLVSVRSRDVPYTAMWKNAKSVSVVVHTLVDLLVEDNISHFPWILHWEWGDLVEVMKFEGKKKNNMWIILEKVKVIRPGKHRRVLGTSERFWLHNLKLLLQI